VSILSCSEAADRSVNPVVDDLRTPHNPAERTGVMHRQVLGGVAVPKKVAVTGSRVRSACKSLPAERVIAVVSNDTRVAGPARYSRGPGIDTGSR
jgi:hypothetical protein